MRYMYVCGTHDILPPALIYAPNKHTNMVDELPSCRLLATCSLTDLPSSGLCVFHHKVVALAVIDRGGMLQTNSQVARRDDENRTSTNRDELFPIS